MPANCCAYCDVGRFLRGEDDDRERASAAYDSLMDSITERSMQHAHLRDEVAATIAGPLSACKGRLRRALDERNAPTPDESGPKIPDLMAALKESLAAAKAGPPNPDPRRGRVT